MPSNIKCPVYRGKLKYHRWFNVFHTNVGHSFTVSKLLALIHRKMQHWTSLTLKITFKVLTPLIFEKYSEQYCYCIIHIFKWKLTIPDLSELDNNISSDSRPFKQIEFLAVSSPKCHIQNNKLYFGQCFFLINQESCKNTFWAIQSNAIFVNFISSLLWKRLAKIKINYQTFLRN